MRYDIIIKMIKLLFFTITRLIISNQAKKFTIKER